MCVCEAPARPPRSSPEVRAVLGALPARSGNTPSKIKIGAANKSCAESTPLRHPAKLLRVDGPMQRHIVLLDRERLAKIDA